MAFIMLAVILSLASAVKPGPESVTSICQLPSVTTLVIEMFHGGAQFELQINVLAVIIYNEIFSNVAI